ncbi:MAG: hypothetical protein KDJ28_01515 [Candidatus Competibacteraceae bacterium]|nr:hypothetical protein [Candidatus Competibacteraceae bacterium]
MGDFYRCIDFILAEEGGYANHPADPGGETKYGISKRAYPHLNIAALTLEDATELYERDYWQPIHGEAFPDGLALLLFDAAVNQGSKTAVRLLQQALKVTVDGIPGPNTQTTARLRMPRILTDFAAERALRYEFNSNESTFGRGWYRRLLTLHSIAVRWHE